MSLTEKLIYLKIYMNRSVGYLALINAGMILFLFLSKLNDEGIILLDLDKFFVPIFLIGILLLILVGWIEINKFKGIQTESTINKNLSPPYIELFKKLDKIEERIDGLEKKLDKKNKN